MAEELNLIDLVVHILPVLEVECYGEVVSLSSEGAVESCVASGEVVTAVRVLNDVLKDLVVVVVDAESVQLHLGNHAEEVAVRAIRNSLSDSRSSGDVLYADVDVELFRSQQRSSLSSCVLPASNTILGECKCYQGV